MHDVYSICVYEVECFVFVFERLDARRLMLTARATPLTETCYTNPLTLA